MTAQKRKKLRGLLATDNGAKLLQDKRNEKRYSYEKLAEVAEVNFDQVKRLSNPHLNRPVQRDAIEKIARALDLHPTEIVAPNQWYPPLTGQEIRVGGKIWIDSVVCETMPPELLAELTQILEKIPGNMSLQVTQIQQGSLILFFETSPEGFEQIQARFISGDLALLLNMEVRDVRLDYVIEAPVNLDRWFQNDFAEAIQEGWLTVEEVFGNSRRNPAFRSQAVKRAKSIQLGDRTLALTFDLTQTSDRRTSLTLGVYPLDGQSYLPENINLRVLPEEGEPLLIPVASNSPGIIQELLVSAGENFSIQISLEGDEITGNFTV